MPKQKDYIQQFIAKLKHACGTKKFRAYDDCLVYQGLVHHTTPVLLLPSPIWKDRR
jgi:hypothetical protein